MVTQITQLLAANLLNQGTGKGSPSLRPKSKNLKIHAAQNAFPSNKGLRRLLKSERISLVTTPDANDRCSLSVGRHRVFARFVLGSPSSATSAPTDGRRRQC